MISIGYLIKKSDSNPSHSDDLARQLSTRHSPYIAPTTSDERGPKTGVSICSKPWSGYLLDHFVGAGGDGLRKNETQLLRRTEIDCGLKLRWELDRQVTWRGTSKNARNVIRNTQAPRCKIGTVTDETSVPTHARPLAHGWQARSQRHARQDCGVPIEYWRSENSHRLDACGTHRGEGFGVVVRSIREVCVDLKSKPLSDPLHLLNGVRMHRGPHGQDRNTTR